jgi:tetratricopeptide (TPR) repeat protein
MKVKTALFSIIIGLILFALALPAHALFDSDVDKAKDYMKAGMYSEAVKLLEMRIKQKPTDAESHYLLGTCFLNMGNYRGADERFDSVMRVEPQKYGSQIGKEYKNAADKAVSNRNLLQAQSLYERGIKYDPNLKEGAYDFYVQLGDQADSATAARLYESALQYTQGNEERRKKVGCRLLKLAAKEYPGARCETLKKEAAGIVGQDLVDKVFPPAYMKVTFEKTYTFDDAYDKAYGQINTIKFGYDDCKVGDQIEVIAEPLGGGKFTGKEIYIWRGKKFIPKWAKTENGYYTQSVQWLPPKAEGKFYVISLDKRKDVEVTVKVSRGVTPKPNFDALKNL